jgi:cysteine desulfurase
MLLGVRHVYLDHNATTPVAREVARAMERALEQAFGNPSSLHTEGRAARGLVEEARERVAALLACAPGEVVFTSGGTEGNNTVIKGVFLDAQRRRGASRCHLITSRIEHDSVLGAAAQVEALGGRVTTLAARADGRVDPGDLESAIDDDTILISLMHGNNETGAIAPIAELARIARARGVLFHTDAVQTFGKISTRVAELGCDFLTLSAHKINGPKGAGAIYLRGGATFFPLLAGGDQERSLRTGTEGVHQIVGLGAAAELCRARMSTEGDRLWALRDELLAGLRTIAPDLRVHEAPRAHQLPGTLNVAFPGRQGIRLLAGLDCWNVSVSVGSACTADRIEPSHVLLGMGVGEDEALSSIRLSMGTTTRSRDLRYVTEVLARVLEHPPEGLSYLDPRHLDEARIRSPNTFLVDLRFPHERVLAPAIPQARAFHHVAFDRYSRKIPRDHEVILICTTGVLSYAAGYRLANAGHPKVRVLQGGYAAWRALFPGLLERLQQSSSSR